MCRAEVVVVTCLYFLTNTAKLSYPNEIPAGNRRNLCTDRTRVEKTEKKNIDTTWRLRPWIEIRMRKKSAVSLHTEMFVVQTWFLLYTWNNFAWHLIKRVVNFFHYPLHFHFSIERSMGNFILFDRLFCCFFHEIIPSPQNIHEIIYWIIFETCH